MGLTFTKVEEHVLFEIQKKFKNYGLDISESLRTEAKIDWVAIKPTRSRSIEVTKADQEFEQATFDFEYQSNLEEFKKRKEAYGKIKRRHSRGFSTLIATKKCKQELRKMPTTMGKYLMSHSCS